MYTKENLNIQLTSSACPEQYDIYLSEGEGVWALVGYIRLRHWELRVDYYGKDKENKIEETIYEYTFDDGFKGVFYTEEERETYLNIIKEKILERLNKD